MKVAPCMSESILKHLVLSNGLTISLADETRRYFGDFYLVKLQIVCKAAISTELFDDASDLAEAKRLLGDEVKYCRTAEQMGVPSSEIQRVLNRLVEDFEKHALPYLGAPFFPRKLAAAQLKKLTSKSQSKMTSRFQS